MHQDLIGTIKRTGLLPPLQDYLVFLAEERDWQTASSHQGTLRYLRLGLYDLGCLQPGQPFPIGATAEESKRAAEVVEDFKDWLSAFSPSPTDPDDKLHWFAKNKLVPASFRLTDMLGRPKTHAGYLAPLTELYEFHKAVFERYAYNLWRETPTDMPGRTVLLNFLQGFGGHSYKGWLLDEGFTEVSASKYERQAGQIFDVLLSELQFVSEETATRRIQEAAGNGALPSQIGHVWNGPHGLLTHWQLHQYKTDLTQAEKEYLTKMKDTLAQMDALKAPAVPLIDFNADPAAPAKGEPLTIRPLTEGFRPRLSEDKMVVGGTMGKIPVGWETGMGTVPVKDLDGKVIGEATMSKDGMVTGFIKKDSQVAQKLMAPPPSVSMGCSVAPTPECPDCVSGSTTANLEPKLYSQKEMDEALARAMGSQQLQAQDTSDATRRVLKELARETQSVPDPDMVDQMTSNEIKTAVRGVCWRGQKWEAEYRKFATEMLGAAPGDSVRPDALTVMLLAFQKQSTEGIEAYETIRQITQELFGNPPLPSATQKGLRGAILDKVKGLRAQNERLTTDILNQEIKAGNVRIRFDGKNSFPPPQAFPGAHSPADPAWKGILFDVFSDLVGYGPGMNATPTNLMNGINTAVEELKEYQKALKELWEHFMGSAPLDLSGLALGTGLAEKFYDIQEEVDNDARGEALTALQGLYTRIYKNDANLDASVSHMWDMLIVAFDKKAEAPKADVMSPWEQAFRDIMHAVLGDRNIQGLPAELAGGMLTELRTHSPYNEGTGVLCTIAQQFGKYEEFRLAANEWKEQHGHKPSIREAIDVLLEVVVALGATKKASDAKKPPDNDVQVPQQKVLDLFHKLAERFGVAPSYTTFLKGAGPMPNPFDNSLNSLVAAVSYARQEEKGQAVLTVLTSVARMLGVDDAFSNEAVRQIILDGSYSTRLLEVLRRLWAKKTGAPTDSQRPVEDLTALLTQAILARYRERAARNAIDDLLDAMSR